MIHSSQICFIPKSILKVSWLLLAISFCFFAWAEEAKKEESRIFRQWSDASGKFSVEAAYSGDEVGVILLKKRDGTVIKLPPNKLSAADQIYLAELKKPIANGQAKELNDRLKIRTFLELEKLALRERTAKKAAALFQIFLNHPDVPGEEKIPARNAVPSYLAAAAKDLQKLGPKWVTKAELNAAQEKELEWLNDAKRFYALKEFKLADQRFLAAANVNPDGIAALFELGLLYALQDRNSKQAEIQFSKCITKRNLYKDQFSQTERANYIATLNNSTIGEIRQGKLNEALKHLEEILSFEQVPPEVVQNIGRFQYLSANLGKSESGIRGFDLSTTDKFA